VTELSRWWRVRRKFLVFGSALTLVAGALVAINAPGASAAVGPGEDRQLSAPTRPRRGGGLPSLRTN
jgi:hypothetical protein